MSTRTSIYCFSNSCGAGVATTINRSFSFSMRKTNRILLFVPSTLNRAIQVPNQLIDNNNNNLQGRGLYNTIVGTLSTPHPSCDTSNTFSYHRKYPEQQRHCQRYRRMTTTTTTTSGINTNIVETTKQPQMPKILFESNGDYRTEEWLEDSSLPLYSQQSNLPSLPDPSMEETIQRFLPTALPLANTEKERQSLHKVCNDFVTSPQTSILQERLVERQQIDYKNSSWLQHWWNVHVYLQYRTSNALHVSYFFQLPDDPTSPISDHYNRNGRRQELIFKKNNNRQLNLDETPFGIRRAAAVLHATAMYAETIIDGSHPPDTIRSKTNDTPMCSTQYKMLFGACRIPRPHQDSYRVYDLRTKTTTNLYAAVAVRGQFYTIPLTTISTDNGLRTVLSRTNVQNLLQQCIDRSNGEFVNSIVPELGWLTSTHRDNWSEAYQYLLDNIPQISEAFIELHSTVCMICLDWDEENNDTSNIIDDGSTSERTFALQLWHGNNIGQAANRWYDKSIQLIVNRNGNLGLIGEHSMADGMPAMGLCQYLRTNGIVESISSTGVSNNTSTSLSQPEQPQYQPKLIFEDAFRTIPHDIRSKVDEYITNAKQEFQQRCSKHDLHVLFYSMYGSNKMKQWGYSPDAFVQVAMQLAGSRLFYNGQSLVATYEATQTRKFKHGRTETTRSVSPQCHDFVYAMNNKNGSSVDEKRKLLEEACLSHTQYTVNALNGYGVDRHFLGLQMCIKEGEETPELFHHPLFKKSKRWLISTSTVPGCSPGFGNVEPDGIGLGYEVLNDSCIFTCTSEIGTNELTATMCTHLHNALDEMFHLHTTNDSNQQSNNTIRSKL